MKQTAVEFLLNLVVGEDEQGKDVRVKDTLSKSEIEQAKAMDKERMIAFGYRCIGEVDSELGDLIYKKVPEEIYNETFKSE